MELNFDKEIDAILRKARESETAFAAENPQAHLDADTLSAFAENALPEKAKMHSTAHLADCGRCRKILSNLILLNSETESEIVHAGESAIVAPSIPWYRKLFVFPNLAYSLGGLVLVFGGLIAFTVLQSVNTSRNADVSQMSNKPLDTKSAPVAQEPVSASNTANSAANTTIPANSVYQSNTAAPHLSMNSNTSATPANPASVPGDDAPKEVTSAERDLTLAKTEATVPVVTDNVTTDKREELQEKQRSVIAKDDEDKAKLNMEQQAVPSTSGAANKPALNARKKQSDSAKNAETTSVGGKTFRRANNVWYDAAYSNQPTTNVTRGTSEYKKLDSSLRSIVENLGGTVVIVWKSSAYRIQ